MDHSNQSRFLIAVYHMLEELPMNQLALGGNKRKRSEYENGMGFS